MNLEEMYHLNIFKFKEKHLKFCLALQKFGSCNIFSTDDETLFQKFVGILKKFCILSDFDGDYDTLNELGEGYFAKVYKVRNKVSHEIFAAKIFRKNEHLQRNKVIIILKI